MNNCQEDEWFTYYDQLHTEGTDVLQSSSAKASITFSYDTTLPKFSQGAMRMRGLAKDQRLEIFMEKHILQSCFKAPLLNEIMDFLNKQDEPLKIEKIVGLLNENYEPSKVEKIIDFLNKQDEPLKTDIIKTEIIDFLNKNDDPPKVEKIMDFLDQNEVAALSEEHLRFVLQEMDNTLFQELLLILLENESESDDPGQQRRKAEMLNIINTNSSLFLKKRVGSLFERYGAVETKDAELKSVLEEKQKSLIELRSKLLAKISFKDLVDEQKADKFNGTLSTLVEQGIKNCKAIVLFRENFDQDAEAEAETEAETDAESELEADLEVSKVKQEPYRTACGYRIWICNAIDSLRENIDQFDQLEEDIVPLSNMLQSVDTVNTGYIELDPRLYISKNHVRMYTEQHDLFNDSRMPIQDVLMFRDSKGTLHALIITPNEKQELMTSKKDIFKGQDPQMWIESSTGVVVYAGTRPPEVEKDLKYLKIQEQIKFMNGDMKSLLMQDKYVWLPRHLENKKTLLSTKILTNRPEQVEYTGKLLTRVKQLRAKYEQVAIQLLRGVPARTAAESCFTVVTVEDVDKITKISGELLNVDEILKLRAESKEDECVVLSACKLVATFQDCPIDSKLLHELYPAVDNDSISCLSYAYAAKKVLLQLHDTKRPVQASKKRDKTPVLKNQFSDVLHELKILSSTKQDILKKLLMEGVVGNDPELITVIFKAFPDVLNEMTGDLHPVSFAMKNRDYLRLTDLLEQHFAAEKREPENALWIQTAFSDACKNKEIKFLKILIEKSGSLNLPLELVEKIIVALSENEQDDLLKMFFEKCVFQESLEPAKKLKEKYEHLVKALKTNISGMILLSSLTLDIYGNNTQSKDFKYIFEQPNFTIVSKGITQLMMACQEGSLTDYKQLIENGANVFHKAIPQKNVYPSYDPRASAEYDVFAYAVGGGNKEIIKDLLRRENVIESLSLDSIKGVLLQLIVNDKKFDSEFVYEIVQTLIARASLSEKSGKLANELSSLFSYAVKNNNFILAKKLIQTTDPKKISSVCSFSSILETLKLMQTNSEPLNPELVDCFLVALEKIPLEEKLKDSKFVAELQGGICELLKKGDTHHAKRILDAMNAPTFNATFLDRFIQPKHYADLLPHLALIKELSKNISSIIVENKNLGENKPLLSDFMEILNQAPDLDSKENLESISVINEIISALVNGKDTLEIFRFKSKWSSRMQHSQPLLLLLLKHAARNSHNQNCILDVLNEHYPGNLELDYTVYVAEERREKNVNENLLLWAIKNNFKELVELLLEKGARLSDVMPKCRKSGFELLCGTPAYIDKLTPEQLKLLGSVLEKENLVETLAADKYLSYLQVAISQKIENPATYTPIRHLDMGLVSQLMRFSADYEKNLPEEIRQSTFGTFIQTAVNAISYQNDILEVCHTLLEHPVFKKNFSEQQFVKIKDNLLDWNQYRGDAVRGQRNLELLSKILEKTPIEQNDFPKFVECCCRCPQVEQKSEDNHRGKILDLFIQKFTIDQLLSSTDEIVEQLNKLPDDLFEKIIDASIEQSKSASKEEQEIIRVKMLNMLNFLVKKGSNHKIKNFLSKSVDMLRLDKEQKENILFNLVQYNGECKLDNILEEIVEMLDVRSVLADESKKEHLVKLSIENYNSHVFFDYLLSKGYVDKVSPIILDAMIERRHGVDVSAITKFLKKSMGVEALLTAMYVKHTAQVQAQKQQEMGSFGSPAKPATIISQFITYQLSNVNNSIGEPIFQQLAEKIGLKMIEETIKTGLSVESAKKNKNKPVIQEKLVPLQISDTKKDEAELILQEFERKKGLRVVGEAMEEIITNYRSYGRTKNILLEITKFPTLCESILEYYAVKNFSELRGKPIYDSLARNLEAKALEEFAAQFDQAVTNVRQGRRPQV
ncbi:MAG TPA: hypothetical protein VGU44_01060 [Gammaproteobacteria bacterium]|nr:hypothetical protein [Gammaproteobacteria bacterium]